MDLKEWKKIQQDLMREDFKHQLESYGNLSHIKNQQQIEIPKHPKMKQENNKPSRAKIQIKNNKKKSFGEKLKFKRMKNQIGLDKKYMQNKQFPDTRRANVLIQS